MSSDDPDWKRYEKLGEKIVAELNPAATVKWNVNGLIAIGGVGGV